VPLAAVVAAGTLALADVGVVIATGPFHKYPVTFDAPLTLKSKSVPAHIGPLLLALLSVGAGLTVAAVV
jgi:hypothetical protein